MGFTHVVMFASCLLHQFAQQTLPRAASTAVCENNLTSNTKTAKSIWPVDAYASGKG